MKQEANPLGFENINKLIIKYSIPSILALLVGAVYNIVDQIFIGQIMGTTAMAATNVAFPLTPIAISMALLFGIGGASNYNLFSGQKKVKEANEVVGDSLSLMMLSGIIIGVLTFFFAKDMLYFFGATDAIMEYALPYTRIIAIGLPMMLFSTGGANIVRADGSPTYSMIAMMSGALFNIIFDPIFMIVFNLGIEGAALATTLGQAITFLMLMYYFVKKTKSIKLDKSVFKIQFRYVKIIAALGMASCFNQLAMTVAQIVMNNSLRYWGSLSVYGSEIPIAVVGVITKLNMIFMAFAIGLSQGTQPIYGYNYGAKNYERVQQTLKKAIKIVLAISITFFLLFQVFTSQIIGIFGQGSAEYNELATKFMRIFMFMTCVNGLLPVCSNFYTSIGKAAIGLWVSLTRQIIFLIPLIIIIPMSFGIDGIVYAGPIADGMAFALTIYFIVKEWKELNVLKK
ncbi:MATE family efflux transporter [Mycoplasma sp. P36-A1]|uniref:MATE family efflux transporter n=1 Tax=Mycoplasma sp. P36-A1 TaxID=3252900 RepID=UPI003C2AD57B